MPRKSGSKRSRSAIDAAADDESDQERSRSRCSSRNSNISGDTNETPVTASRISSRLAGKTKRPIWQSAGIVKKARKKSKPYFPSDDFAEYDDDDEDNEIIGMGLEMNCSDNDFLHEDSHFEDDDEDDEIEDEDDDYESSIVIPTKKRRLIANDEDETSQLEGTVVSAYAEDSVSETVSESCHSELPFRQYRSRSPEFFLEDDPNMPTLDLPESSSDLLLDNCHLMAALQVYEVLRHYHSIVRLSPFHFEDFCAALCAEDQCMMIVEIYTTLLRALLRDDDAASTVFSPADTKDSVNISFFTIDGMTWLECCRLYLDADSHLKPLLNNHPVKSETNPTNSNDAGENPESPSEKPEDLNSIDNEDSEMKSETDTENPSTVDIDLGKSVILEARKVLETAKSYKEMSVESRLVVLQALTDLFLSSNAVRENILSEGVIKYDDHCRSCHRLGDLLCCETCPAVYHLQCLDKPLQEVPEGDWICDLCKAHELKGVTDCRSELEKHGLLTRQIPIGYDRHRRKYWFLARRVFVESLDSAAEPSCWYYSTEAQLEELLYSLCADKYEKDLVECLEEYKEDIKTQMSITEELTNKSRGASKTLLSELNEKLAEVQSKREEERKSEAEKEEVVKTEEGNKLPDTSQTPDASDDGKSDPSKEAASSSSSNQPSQLTTPTSSLSTGSVGLGGGVTKTVMVLHKDGTKTIMTLPVKSMPEVSPLVSSSASLLSSTATKGTEKSSAVTQDRLTRSKTGSLAPKQFTDSVTTPLVKNANQDYGDFGRYGKSRVSSPSIPSIRPPDFLYRLGCDNTYLKYRNLYATNTLALNRIQHAEEREKKRHLGHKFCMDFSWRGPTGGVFLGTNPVATLSATLLALEIAIPAPFYVAGWKAGPRSEWVARVGKCNQPVEFAQVLAALELNLRPMVLATVFNDGLGHIKLRRIPLAEREEQKKKEKETRKKKEEEELQEVMKANSWIKYSLGIKHSVWKQKGEDYRITGQGGWVWMGEGRPSRFVSAQSQGLAAIAAKRRAPERGRGRPPSKINTSYLKTSNSIPTTVTDIAAVKDENSMDSNSNESCDISCDSEMALTNGIGDVCESKMQTKKDGNSFKIRPIGETHSDSNASIETGMDEDVRENVGEGEGDLLVGEGVDQERGQGDAIKEPEQECKDTIDVTEALLKRTLYPRVTKPYSRLDLLLDRRVKQREGEVQQKVLCERLIQCYSEAVERKRGIEREKEGNKEKGADRRIEKDKEMDIENETEKVNGMDEQKLEEVKEELRSGVNAEKNDYNKTGGNKELQSGVDAEKSEEMQMEKEEMKDIKMEEGNETVTGEIKDKRKEKVHENGIETDVDGNSITEGNSTVKAGSDENINNTTVKENCDSITDTRDSLANNLQCEVDSELPSKCISEPLSTSALSKPVSHTTVSEPMPVSAVSEPVSGSAVDEPISESAVFEPISESAVSETSKSTVVLVDTHIPQEAACIENTLTSDKVLSSSNMPPSLDNFETSNSSLKSDTNCNDIAETLSASKSTDNMDKAIDNASSEKNVADDNTVTESSKSFAVKKVQNGILPKRKYRKKIFYSTSPVGGAVPVAEKPAEIPDTPEEEIEIVCSDILLGMSSIVKANLIMSNSLENKITKLLQSVVTSETVSLTSSMVEELKDWVSKVDRTEEQVCLLARRAPGRGKAAISTGLNGSKVETKSKSVHRFYMGVDSEGAVRRSLFSLEHAVLRWLARHQGKREIPGFNYAAKTANVHWPYPCPRPTFRKAWQFRTQTLKSLSGVAVQMRILWACVKWDDISTRAPSGGMATVTTETDITTKEVLERREVAGVFGEGRVEYKVRRIIVPIGVPSTQPYQREKYTPQRSGLRQRRRPESPKLKEPSMTELWVPEEQLELWQIKLFHEKSLEKQKQEQRQKELDVQRSKSLTTETKPSLDESLKSQSLTNQKTADTVIQVPGTPTGVVRVVPGTSATSLISQLRQPLIRPLAAVQPIGTSVLSPQAVQSRPVGPNVQNVKIIRGANGQIQVHGLLPGQQLIKMPDGRFQLVTATVGNKSTDSTAGTQLINASPQIIEQLQQQAQVGVASQAQVGVASPAAAVQTTPSSNVISAAGNRVMVVAPGTILQSGNQTIRVLAPMGPVSGSGTTVVRLPSGQHILVRGGTAVTRATTPVVRVTNPGVPTGMAVPTVTVAMAQGVAKEAEGKKNDFSVTPRVISEVVSQALAQSQNNPDILAKLLAMQKKVHAQLPPEVLEEIANRTAALPENVYNSYGGLSSEEEDENSLDGLGGGRGKEVTKTASRIKNLEQREEQQRMAACTQVMRGILDSIEKQEKLEEKQRKRQESIDERNRKVALHRLEVTVSRHKDCLKRDMIKKRKILERSIAEELQLEIDNALLAARQQQEQQQQLVEQQRQQELLLQRQQQQLLKSKRKKEKNIPASGGYTIQHHTPTKITVVSPVGPLSPTSPLASQISPGRKGRRSKEAAVAAVTAATIALNDKSPKGKAIETKEKKKKGKREEEDESQLYCVCRTPYDKTKFYIGCDKCEDWFHGSCVGITKSEADRLDTYICPRCAPKGAAPASVAATDTSSCVGCPELTAFKLQEPHFIELRRLITALKTHKMAWPFLQPVSTSEVPDYYLVIKDPMDLLTVQRRVDSRFYKTLGDFIRDVMKIFDNCRYYNQPNTSFYCCAETVELLFVDRLKALKEKLLAK